MQPLIPIGDSRRLRCLGLAASILATACAHSAPDPRGTREVMIGPEPFVAPPGATREKPEAANSKKNVCSDPQNYPPPAFDIPQLSAAHLMALFNSPSTARELLSNIKLLVGRDLLVQSAFFNDDVLLKFFGASEITWEKSEPPQVYAAPYPQVAFGPTRVAHVSALRGALSNVTVRVVSSHTCMGWRNMKFLRGALGDWWWPPVTYDSGAMQIDVSHLDGLNVGIVKEVFGPDPDEAPHFFMEEFGGGISFPGHLTYENHDKETRAAPFDRHQIEFIPQQTGQERPERPGGRRVFADEKELVRINISQHERDL